MVIALNSALPNIQKSVSIIGLGPDNLTVQRSNTANTNFRIFTTVNAITVDISGMTIADGRTDVGEPGGGIRNDRLATMNLYNVEVIRNMGSSGGGIFNEGTMTVENSRITLNQTPFWGYGGGICNAGGRLWIQSDSRIRFNEAYDGGGVCNFRGGTMTITDSDILSNHAKVFGGGIFTDGNFSMSGGSVRSNSVGSGRPVNPIVDGPANGGGIYIDFDAGARRDSC